LIVHFSFSLFSELKNSGRTHVRVAQVVMQGCNV
jgi:hypothetical protein